MYLLDARADALLRDPRPLAEAFEEQRHPIFGQWQARLREKEMILPGAAPVLATCAVSRTMRSPTQSARI